MNQLHLPPAAATADPVTSRIADQQITASGHRETRALRAARLVREHEGLTCLELSKLTGIERHTLQKGLSDAEAAKLVVADEADKRACSVSGRLALTWRARR